MNKWMNKWMKEQTKEWMNEWEQISHFATICHMDVLLHKYVFNQCSAHIVSICCWIQGCHIYFLFHVVMVLLWCHNVLLFEINICCDATMVSDIIIVQSDVTIIAPYGPVTGSIYDFSSKCNTR